ncbi:MAG: YbjQ family protein [Selenomonadales bacterium]|nr:YbjQ family protein [Selenomonadales bacterium]MBQ6713064.1 YbjQ family protein [Selenomonadales bacterium]
MMITTTTATIQGKEIVEYKGLVFGEVVAGVNFIKDIFSGLRDVFGGRSGTYEAELAEAREEAIKEMMQRAEKLGANAIIGIDIDYEVIGQNNGMLMVSASGTAVIVK